MGYKLYEAGEAVEKEITRLIEYRVKKDILVPKKIKNGLMKLVKIKKDDLEKYFERCKV